jgi:hypothetical protein
MATFPAFPGAGPGRLYVFLHGLICLVETKDKFLGLVVDMGSEHSYRAGDWLTELPVERGAVITLKNVSTGAGTVDVSQVSVIQAETLFPFPQLYATLVFPRPSRVLTLRRTDIPPDVLTGGGLSRLSRPREDTMTLSSLNILQYDFEDAGAVHLDGHPWGPPTVYREPRVATLHFYAEPEVGKSMMHPIEEFNASSRLFQGFDVTLHEVLKVHPLETAEYPAELSTNEALGLAERTPLLGSLAAFYKGNSHTLPAPAMGGGTLVVCGNFVARVVGA